ncbi:hypothetical protein [Erythrobacter oryzae]|uniref:hypothetical protein n=1 Tax=Erythrobacter oryzae TaxID=3019556 RepID=UPI002556B1D6|nr:hypothetical protein [Erythrobacter sp. COR-2]
MPIVRPSLAVVAALMALTAPIAAQTNPLAGDTQAPQAAVITDAFGGLIIPAEQRGQLRPDPASADTGGVAFADELGWYRFTMADGGTTSLQGTMRKFEFPAGTIPTTCFAVRVPDASFARFPLSQIQAELDTLYTPFDPLIVNAGFAIEARQTLVLDAPGQRSAAPLKLLGWDTRNADGLRATWTLMPSQVGNLLFTCSGAEPAHQREVIQRYLRIGSAMTSGGAGK